MIQFSSNNNNKHLLSIYYVQSTGDIKIKKETMSELK